MELNQPLITIIIPVYNVEDYLSKCIDSVISQSYRNLEIIIVDDGSRDCCGEICDTYAKQDSRIKVIHQDNRGLSVARNVALDAAHGQYILFVDSDDWIDRDTCKKTIDIAIDKDVDVVIFGFRHVNKYGREKEIVKAKASRYIDASTAIGHIINYTGGVGNFAWNKLYKSSLFQEIRYPVGKLYEDNAVTYKLLHYSKRIYITDDILYNYLYRKGSISYDRYTPPQAIMDRIVIWNERLIFLKKHYPEHLKAQLSPMLVELLYGRIVLKKTPYYKTLCQYYDSFILENQLDIKFLSNNNKRIWLYFHSKVAFYLYMKYFS